MSMALEAGVPPGHLPSIGFGNVGLAEPTLKKLQADLADIVGRIYSHMRQLHMRLINCTSLDEFRSLRDKNFQSYLGLRVAISNIVESSTIDPIEYAYMAQECIQQTADEFTKSAKPYLGEEAYQEVLFCLSTIKSAARWLPRLREVEPSDKKKDKELAGEFFITDVYVNLHLDCLKLAIERNQTLCPEVLIELMNGIRRAVMVYSFARAGLELRNFPPSPEKIDMSWDAEDEALSKAD